VHFTDLPGGVWSGVINHTSSDLDSQTDRPTASRTEAQRSPSVISVADSDVSKTSLQDQRSKTAQICDRMNKNYFLNLNKIRTTWIY